MRMDLGMRNTLLYDFMHCMTVVSLEMSDEPKIVYAILSALLGIFIRIYRLLLHFSKESI